MASNYYASCRSRSHAEFTAKIGVVEEEADESGFWLKMLFDTSNAAIEEVMPLLKEANELTAIFTSSAKTAKGNRIAKKVVDRVRNRKADEANPQSTISKSEIQRNPPAEP